MRPAICAELLNDAHLDEAGNGAFLSGEWGLRGLEGAS
jgi:hypothetical protein